MRHYGVIEYEDRRGLASVLGLLTGIISGTAGAVWIEQPAVVLVVQADPGVAAAGMPVVDLARGVATVLSAPGSSG